MNKISKSIVNRLKQSCKSMLLTMLPLVILSATTASAAVEMSTENTTIMTTEMTDVSEIIGALLEEKMTKILISFLFVLSIISITVLLTLLWNHYDKKDKRYKEKMMSRFRLFACPIIGLISLFVLYGCIFYYVNPPKTAGEFGDMYGALNTLFSGLAFAVIAITLCVEIRALREQKHDAQLQIIDAASFEYLKYMKECKSEKVEDKKEDIEENIEKAEEIIRKLFCNEKNMEVDQLKKINELRKNLFCLSAWRRVMSSWFMKVDNFSITDEEKEEYKKQFWHLLPKEERIVAYFQVFLFSKTHKEATITMENLFRYEDLIKELIGTQDQKYKDLKSLLKKEGEGDYKLKLNEELFNEAKKGK